MTLGIDGSQDGAGGVRGDSLVRKSVGGCCVVALSGRGALYGLPRTRLGGCGLDFPLLERRPSKS
jgi:hypothetical protein